MANIIKSERNGRRGRNRTCNPRIRKYLVLGAKGCKSKKKDAVCFVSMRLEATKIDLHSALVPRLVPRRPGPNRRERQVAASSTGNRNRRYNPAAICAQPVVRPYRRNRARRERPSSDHPSQAGKHVQDAFGRAIQVIGENRHSTRVAPAN
jgi:hypothetical protein